VWQAVEAVAGRTSAPAWAGVADFGEGVRRIMPERAVGTLTLAEITAAFDAIAAATGSGSRQQRVAMLADLFDRATPLEAKYLAKIVVGEMRHGVQEGLVLDAIAALGGVAPEAVRRAQQALGDIGRLAALVRTDAAQLDAVSVRLFQPIKPMLAQSATDIAAAFALLGGRLRLEWKLDGARVQIHKQGSRVRMFSRRLQDITPAALTPRARARCRRRHRVRGLAHRRRRRPAAAFQALMRRFVASASPGAREVPRLYPRSRPPDDRRWPISPPPMLDRARSRAAAIWRVPHVEPATLGEGEAFYQAALLAPATRGAGEAARRRIHARPVWLGLKIKPNVTLDLVVVAADWAGGAATAG
jgi:DNA ligase-1